MKTNHGHVQTKDYVRVEITNRPEVTGVNKYNEIGGIKFTAVVWNESDHPIILDAIKVVGTSEVYKSVGEDKPQVELSQKIEACESHSVPMEIERELDDPMGEARGRDVPLCRVTVRAYWRYNGKRFKSHPGSSPS